MKVNVERFRKAFDQLVAEKGDDITAEDLAVLAYKDLEIDQFTSRVLTIQEACDILLDSYQEDSVTGLFAGYNILMEAAEEIRSHVAIETMDAFEKVGLVVRRMPEGVYY